MSSVELKQLLWLAICEIYSNIIGCCFHSANYYTLIRLNLFLTKRGGFEKNQKKNVKSVYCTLISPASRALQAIRSIITENVFHSLFVFVANAFNHWQYVGKQFIILVLKFTIGLREVLITLLCIIRYHPKIMCCLLNFVLKKGDKFRFLETLITGNSYSVCDGHISAR